MTAPIEALRDVWAASGMPAEGLEDVTLTGTDPVLPSSFAVGTAAQASIAAGGLAAATLGRMRGLPRQGVAVDMRHAATEFHSEGWLQVNGAPPPEAWDRIAGTYPCGDGRFVRLHTNFPHHRDGVLRLLGCAHEREAVRGVMLDHVRRSLPRSVRSDRLEEMAAPDQMEALLGLVCVLARGWGVTGRHRKLLLAAISHAVAVSTWQSLVCEQLVSDQDAVEMLTAMVCATVHLNRRRARRG